MKTRLLLALILGLLFIHPKYALSLQSKRSNVYDHSLERILQEEASALICNSAAVPSSFTSASSGDDELAADLDVDDDDDFSISARRKLIFDEAFHFDFIHVQRFNYLTQRRYRPFYSYHLLPSYFISLRVFRL